MPKTLEIFAQALLTGLLGGLVAGALAFVSRADDPWQIAFTFGSLAAFVAWLSFRGWAARLIEHKNGMTPPAQQTIEPPRMLSTVRVELGEQVNGARWMDYIDIDITAEKLYQLAQGLNAGRAPALSAWTGRGKPFTRSEFETIRAEFIMRGLARWRSEGNPQQGIELTAKGRAVCHGVAMKTSPLPALNRPKIER